MINSLENIKKVTKRYYLNEMGDNDELRALFKDSIQETDIEEPLQIQTP